MTIATGIFIEIILVIVFGLNEVLQCGFFNSDWTVQVFLIPENLIDNFQIVII